MLSEISERDQQEPSDGERDEREPIDGQRNREFADNLVGLGFLQSFSYIKPILTHDRVFAVGKSGQNATFSLIFFGLGWPRVGEFVGFIIICTCFSTQPKLVLSQTC